MIFFSSTLKALNLAITVVLFLSKSPKTIFYILGISNSKTKSLFTPLNNYSILI
jgi:hypothetical protein